MSESDNIILEPNESNTITEAVSADNESSRQNSELSGLIKIIKEASDRAYQRILLFGLVLIITLILVYYFITNSDFFDSIESFKKIDGNEAVEKLNIYTNESSELNNNLDQYKRVLSKYEGYKKNINNDSYNIININNSNLDILFPSLDKNNFDKPIAVDIILNHTDFGNYDILYSTTMIIPKNFHFILSEYIENRFPPYNEKFLKYTFNLVTNEIEKNNNIQVKQKFMYSLNNEISNIQSKIIAKEEAIKSKNGEILKIVTRLKSNDILYASAIFQKVMLSMLIVSIGLYFLKAIGADLLFIRKITIINLSQSLLNESNDKDKITSVDLYNALSSEVEKTGKAPETIQIKTLTDIFSHMPRSK
jgi:hypothetical protein